MAGEIINKDERGLSQNLCDRLGYDNLCDVLYHKRKIIVSPFNENSYPNSSFLPLLNSLPQVTTYLSQTQQKSGYDMGSCKDKKINVQAVVVLASGLFEF